MGKRQGSLITALIILAVTCCWTLPSRAAQDCTRAREMFKQSFRIVEAKQKAEVLRQAAELCPADVLIWNNLGAAYEMLFQTDLARAAYLKALELDPAFAPAQAGMGDVAMQEGRFKEAEKHYSLFLKGMDKAITQGDPQKLTAHREEYQYKLEDAKFRIEAQEKSGSGLVSKALIIQGLDSRGDNRAQEGAKPPAPARMAFNNILFGYDSADLAEGAKPQLKEIASALKSPELKGQQFIIAGHTDSHGSEKYNRELSLKRAQSVREFMAAQGVDQARLRVKGYGESRLIILSGDKDRQALNRRMEMVNAESGSRP